MRGFLTLCLIAAASAQGYNYAANGGGSLSGSGLHGGFIGGGLSSGGLGSQGSYGGVISSGGSSGLFSSGGAFSSGRSIGGGGFVAPAQTITELNKEFYTYSAPEEQVHVGDNSQGSITKLKKNLRVIFIKAPENNAAANVALQVAKQITEDQTAIYVLTKENDVSEITQQLQQLSEVRSRKPEVRFVKYRTAQDALNAQRSIQAQYDGLGGSSKSSNEGIAPVLNYASSAPASNVQGSSSQLSGSLAAVSGSDSASQKSYLPPGI